MKKHVLVLLTSSALLAGCVAGPEKPNPTIALPASYAEGTSASTGTTAANAWWQSFRDPLLDQLVATGQTGNLSVQQAMQRIVAAQANADVAASGALPTLSVNTTATVRGNEGSAVNNPGVTRTASAGAGVSWFIDLFGRYRRAQEAADARLASAYDSVEVTRLAFLSQAVSAYVDTRYYQEAIALTRKNLASRRQTLELTQSMLASGQATRADVVRAQALVDGALADLPPLDAGFHRAANRLATLLGQPATSLDGQLSKGRAQPMPGALPKSGVPADLIRNRPDIRTRENELTALTAEIGIAQSQLYPSITLSGSISLARTVSSAVTGNATAWSFGPALDLPIFDGNRRKANVDIARSQAAEAYLVWKQTVLTAVEEVQSSMISVKRARDAVAAQRQVVTSEEEALKLARESFQAGATSILDVLDAERSVANARLALAASIRQLALDYVTLNVALGSGAALDGSKS